MAGRATRASAGSSRPEMPVGRRRRPHRGVEADSEPCIDVLQEKAACLLWLLTEVYCNPGDRVLCNMPYVVVHIVGNSYLQLLSRLHKVRTDSEEVVCELCRVGIKQNVLAPVGADRR